jgi:nucleotide-binding universal stress UspA family protein
MLTKRKILVATDFGEPSKAAADLALELAKQFEAPLVLVHSYLLPASIYAGALAPPFADYARAFEDAARELLEQEGLRLADRGAVVTTMLRAGVAWEEILAAAKELEVGLIVVGTHGRRGLPRALLGSVTEKVVRLSPVPVLTIHEAPGK